MLFYLFFGVTILFLLFLLSMVWPPDSPWAPWWRTSKKTARAMCKLADVKKEDIVYDLGSGEGTALLIAAKEFGATGFGVEIDPVRFLFSKFILKINGLSNKVKIKRGNLFKQDISKASVIFVYLVPKTLDRLLPKFKKELKKGTRIISYRYEMNLPLKEYNKENQIRLYII
ncbi:MAG: 50S ribosomal protein L11 methyltransferase [Patescibacteria group bacterium]|nr:50S ribosomal protein L11 methyltransferase [Patescibacteria group bacterium]